MATYKRELPMRFELGKERLGTCLFWSDKHSRLYMYGGWYRRRILMCAGVLTSPISRENPGDLTYRVDH